MFALGEYPSWNPPLAAEATRPAAPAHAAAVCTLSITRSADDTVLEADSQTG